MLGGSQLNRQLVELRHSTAGMARLTRSGSLELQRDGGGRVIPSTVREGEASDGEAAVCGDLDQLSVLTGGVIGNHSPTVDRPGVGWSLPICSHQEMIGRRLTTTMARDRARGAAVGFIPQRHVLVRG